MLGSTWFQIAPPQLLTKSHNLKKYNKLYQELHNELSTKELQKFDKLLDTLNNINNDELISIYKTATYDFLNLKNNQFIKNNNKKIIFILYLFIKSSNEV